jgi:hypothetical protein
MGLAGCQERGGLIAWSKKAARLGTRPLSLLFFLRGAKGNVELSINSIGDFLGILFRPPGAAIKTDKPITQDNINFKDFAG